MKHSNIGIRIAAVFFLLTVMLIAVISGCLNTGKDLIIAANGECAHRIILPRQHNDTLKRCAYLIKEAFAANGFEVPVVTEDNDEAGKPGIYLGDTEFARQNDIEPSQFEDWSYLIKVVDRDVIITGSNTGKKKGVVKGVYDFLREYAGTRFFYPGKTGIEFLDIPMISIPAGLELAFTPMLKFNYRFDMYPEEWLYNIANNNFPSDFEWGSHMWEFAVPFDKYYETHPEYFAIVKGKRYERESKSQYCISNPKVMDLIVEYMVQLAEEGREIIVLAQPDAFTPCECGECYKLYGTGDDWDEKVWLFHIEIVERFQEYSPDTKVLMLAYQATTHPPKTIDKLPDNTMVLLTHAYREALEKWSESRVKVPGGFILGKRMFGSHYFVLYLPKRTPDWVEAVVKDFYYIDLDIVGLRLFGGGDCYGLEGPVFYVFGRMFDDPPNNNATDLAEEFYTAAFGEVINPMRRFYGILHDNLRFCSEWYFPRSPSQFHMGLDRKPAGVDDQLDWVRVSTAKLGSRGMHATIPDPGKGLSLIFTPDMILNMEKELQEAEVGATGDKVKKRLELVRMEFNYMKNVITVNDLYKAWKVRPDHTSLERLLNAVDNFHASLDSYYNEDGIMKSVQGWPEIRPFRNTARPALGFLTDRHWGRKKEYMDNPYAWDTEAMCDSVQQISAKAAESSCPGISSAVTLGPPY